jgi:hypothetical protein
MCDIFVIIFTAIRVAKIAKDKGRSSVGYVFMALAFCIIGEIGGIVGGVVLANEGNMNQDDAIFPIAIGGLVGLAIGVGISFAIVSSLSPIETRRRRYDDGYEDDYDRRARRRERYDDDYDDRPRRRREEPDERFRDEDELPPRRADEPPDDRIRGD